ncbi:UDP-N-acetylmuramoyl-L-alanyl-D-glutamate--2,6-diaminopimelate ligase [Nocardioides bizhenqiangii]|uniref:UDP-N-acetylmuramoyl-L-alanyl-D-glutamate--2,6-diaminopimelate ligase n=1 Tax=Nocardioides bizhenqiangii TaxID=3095076 RepID=A0ABZ0ZL16_9ACTN|nr:UDP-N-acetylmuramoyl-L-alanyl-D-glutamate--2,6-diaminopimelate ligase [Nocardioides sp. HM61]WQQ25017.1 UDP-N-acetylmuramoyl-L-alanyl-D-glutamate--2,6-diaminopimelate ligase [Nocardioides sp. HM61]
MDTGTTRPRHPAALSFDDVVALVREQDEARVVGGDGADVAVTGITLDSRRVLPGDVYAALPGARAHGIDFVTQAAAAGASVVLTDETGAAAVPAGLPAVVVAQPRGVLGAVSAGIYGHPARAMRMIGVTGTQGKTTATRLLDSGLGAAGIASAVVGTVGTRLAGTDLKTTLTTPEAPDLHGLFALMREEGITCCAMEVSSHALVLGRVDGVVFDVAVFTNLGRDHLDFHADLDDYFAAKAALFTPGRARLGLVNVDDEHGRRLVTTATIPIRTMSTHGRDADWSVTDVELGPEGSTFTIRGPGGLSLPASVALPGDFNVANALSAVAAATEAGLDPEQVVAGVAATGGVPGRLERVSDETVGFAVYVDYAHKPDALTAVLATLRPVTAGRLIVVIGAGGDRDRGKRPAMGAIAAAQADLVIVTDDNPRTEQPAEIRAAVLAGIDDVEASRRAEVLEVGDRRAAIATALDAAGPGDVVLVAGKGHETGQEIDGVIHPFDDREVVRELLRGAAR